MSRHRPHTQEDEEGILGTGIRTRDIELLGRKITTTANHLLATTTETTQTTYNQAFAEIHRELRRPGLQRSVFSFAKSSPKELIRSTVSTTEIQQRALSYIPDDLLKDVPSSETRYSLFQGFEASVPEHDEEEEEGRPKHHGHRKSQKLIEGVKKLEIEDTPSSGLTKLKKERDKTARKLEMMGVRKNMCSVEITEIDRKIANLNIMRKIVLDRLSGLEEEEVESEQQLTGLDYKIEDLTETIREAEERAAALTPSESVKTGPRVSEEPEEPMMAPEVDTFMSASIYEKLPSSRTPKRGRPTRRISTPIRHGHLGPGALIRELPGHNDIITSLDFDLPFGTMVSAALDDTVRVWDLHNGRCLGFLEGHLASVRCLQVEDNLVATGSIDATVRLWDLNKADIVDPPGKFNTETILEEDEDDIDEYEDIHHQGHTNAAAPASHSSMADCPVFTLEAHVSEITALHFHKDTLVSGSADKTMRQWDLTTGRCVQTLDVLWAAAQAAANMPSASAAMTPWRTAGRLPVGEADFIGALQCFDAALACATADGMVRLWDLRSGQVSRSLVGHTEPVTCLQFDDTHLVTGSLDRSIRIWDLRTGMLHDAFTFDNPITSMMFDSRRIVAATGEPVVKVFDKTDGKIWDCGDGSGSTVERVRVKDGFLLGGKRDGSIGVWAC